MGTENLAAATAGCLGAVLVAGQSGKVGSKTDGGAERERERGRGRTSVPTTAIRRRAEQNDLRSSECQPRAARSRPRVESRCVYGARYRLRATTDTSPPAPLLRDPGGAGSSQTR